MDRLFVAYKPAGMSSNRFLGQIKRRYKVKKGGYSGTLDPFAQGVLIVALGNHGRLFRFLAKTPKRYRATVWLGAYSPTLDIEQIEQIQIYPPWSEAQIVEALEALRGTLTYLPPKYSAKRIDGQRAYALARAGHEVTLGAITSHIDEVRLCHYCHPFVTFEVSVSEGTYVRSLGEMIAHALGCEGSLSMLERLCEGRFVYDQERPIAIKESLAIPQNHYLGSMRAMVLGQKLVREMFTIQDDGDYWIDGGDTITIVRIDAQGVHYLLNQVNV